jgi:hypothetical protein
MVGHRSLPRCFDYRTPLARPEWTRFILSVPRQLRHWSGVTGQLLVKHYPALARVPSNRVSGQRALLGSARSPVRTPGRPALALDRLRTVAGLGRGVSAFWGGFPFQEFLRERSDVRSTIEELMESAARRPFLDGEQVTRLWRRYRRGWETSWRRVDRVASLEAILQAYGL